MGRLCLILIIFCCGTFGNIDFIGYAWMNAPYSWSILENTRGTPAVAESIDIREPNTLREKLLSLGDVGKTVRSVSFQCALVDEDVEVLCSMPNLRSVKALSRDAVNDAVILKLIHLPDLRELGFFSQQGTITDSGLQLLGSFKALEKLSLCNGKYTDNGLTYIGELEQLQELHLSSKVITDEGLAFLEKLTELRELHILSSDGVTDAGLMHLRCLGKLENLRIWWCHLITGEGLFHLSHLRSLKRLSLNSLGMTASGFARIENLHQLSELTIYGSPLDDKGMASLGQLTNLRKLELLYVNNVTDSGLSHVQNLHSLADLSIRGNSITGEGLSHLLQLQSLVRLELGSQGLTMSGVSNMKDLRQVTEFSLDGAVTNEMLRFFEDNPTLETLKISSRVESRGPGGGVTVTSKVNDTGIEPLETLRNLKFLDISGTRITKRGLDKLQQALPDCQIKSRM